MKITSEADYALRIVSHLAREERLADSGAVSDAVKVSERFTVKILRKLMLGGLGRAQKGASGGYELARDPGLISMRHVIELIDGPLTMNKCLDDTYECSRNSYDKGCCKFHLIFEKLNLQLSKKLGLITIDMIADNSVGADEILQVI